MDYGENFYKCLPLEFLADFYIEIKKNIDKKILSEAMFVELNLIEGLQEKRDYQRLNSKALKNT